MNQSILTTIVIFAECFILRTSTLPLSGKEKTTEHHVNQFVGFYVFPHGSIILDPKHMDYSRQPAFTNSISKQKAINLHDAMQKAADSLIKSDPDLIIFSTPHGFSLDDVPLIVSPFGTFGDAGGIWENFTAEFSIDQPLSSILYEELRRAKNAIEFLNFGNGHQSLPILWAEVIPWYFITQAANKARSDLPPAIYIGAPPQVHISKLTSIGRGIVKTTLKRKEFANKSIAVVISGDLSHYHSSDPAAPYPFSSVSSVFDKHIVNWAKLDRIAANEGESSDHLLVKAGGIEGQVGHCGYSGLVMLHGMLQEMVHQNSGYKFKSHFYAYEVPSYFGMMVTSWTPVKMSL